MPDTIENAPAAQSTASATGEPALTSSVPAQPVASGSTDTQAATPSTAQASTQTSDAIPKTADGAASTTVGTAPLSQGEPGNVGGSTNAPANASMTATGVSAVGTGEQGNVQSAVASGGDASSATAELAAQPPLSDSEAADVASRVLVIPTPPTDSQTSSPTGGPTAGRGDTPEAKAKHGFLDRVREDLHAELTAIEGLPQYVLHILKAVFDRHHSHVDNDAAQ
jgi:hypothetical protein